MRIVALPRDISMLAEISAIQVGLAGADWHRSISSGFAALNERLSGPLPEPESVKAPLWKLTQGFHSRPFS